MRNIYKYIYIYIYIYFLNMLMWKNVRVPNSTWQALKESKKSQTYVRSFGFIVYINDLFYFLFYFLYL